MSRRYADLEFDENELDSINDLVGSLDCIDFEAMLQEFVEDAIKSGYLREYLQSKLG